jgi:flagellar basal-body rod modification protein FlgD
MNNTIQDSNFATAFAPNNAANGSVSKGIEDTQDRFLKLLVTQMQNQDPLNPLDNSEVTSQLAQINTVTGINKLNETLQLLVSDVDAANSLEAASMIGRNVLVPGKTLDLQDNAAVAGFDLPQAVDEVTITIKDSSGIAIRNIDLGSQEEGVIPFTWDGATDSGTSAVNGNYSFTVSAKQGDEIVNATTLAFGSVKSVSPDENGTILDIGELGLANLADIKQIF